MPSTRLIAPLLLLSALAACVRSPAVADAPAADVMAVTEPRELTADQQVAHALSRLTFGARPGDAQRVRRMGVDRWIAQQLEPRRIDDRAMERFLDTHYEILDRSAAELLEDFPRPTADSARVARRRRADRAVREDLGSAKLARAVGSERQLEEVMVDFWENHFSVFAGKGPTLIFLPEYDRAIRAHALGRFRDLLGAVAESPAMLFYLDNWQSAADSGRPVLGPRPEGRGPRARRSRRIPPMPRAPGLGPYRAQRGLNENYARELLELHTLGVDGGYTQQDVIEVARALTGWSLAGPRRGGGFIFRPEIHDAGAKLVLGHRLSANRGIEDGEEVLDIVARHPSTARHIARKLAVRFVSDSPPPALIDRAAETFQRTDGDIRATLRTILTSAEFFSTAAYRAKVKSPFELVASAMRALNATPDSTARTAFVVARLGQPPFGHRDPNGYPEIGEGWISAGSILDRINFGMAVAAGRVPGASLDGWPVRDSLASAEREMQVQGVIDQLLGGDASPDTRAVLLAGENPLARPDGDEPMRARRLDGLPLVVGLALGAPEFQRR